MIFVSVQHEPIDIAREFARVDSQGGAVATFTGHVRADDGVTELFLEHYPGYTERALMELVDSANERWSLQGSAIVHRVGPMEVGDRIVFIATVAQHRKAALSACAYIIDRLKIDVPLWKSEVRGSKRKWVEAREQDLTAADDWVPRDIKGFGPFDPKPK